MSLISRAVGTIKVNRVSTLITYRIVPTTVTPCLQNVFIIHKHNSTAIPHPSPEGQEKIYPQKIKNIVDEISKLTLIEVSDLNELLRKTLNIQDTPMMAFGAMPTAASPAPENEEEEEVATSKTSYTVKLVKYDDGKKVSLIKEIKGLMEGMNLVQAKKFVESVPQIVKANLAKDEAENLQKTLEAAGGSCQID